MSYTVRRRDFLKRISRLTGLAAGSWALGPLTSTIARAEVLRARPGRVGTFRMVVAGDSVAWGQGLAEEEKYSAKVQSWLKANLTDQPEVMRHVYAHSGAIIAPDPHGDAEGWYGREVPTDYPSITKQIALARANLPADEIDLVLLDGGINDVGVTNILTVDPTIWDKPAQIREWTRRKCGDRMVSLLADTLRAFPRARIVVTNYFPIISRQSPLVEVGALLAALGLLKGGPVGAAAGAVLTLPLRDALADQCAAFNEESTLVLRNAVSGANAESNRVAFADVGFGAHNAYAASQSYLYLVGENDPARSDRKLQCERAGLELNPKCLNASMGHPNPRGAQRYADSIIAQLQLLIPECAP